MDFKHIIENDGYGKLAEKLPDYQKGILQGFDCAIEALDTFLANIDIFIGDEGVEILKQLQEQMAEVVIANAKMWIDNERDEHLVAFVDQNHFSLDENGNIIDENEGD